MSQDPQTSADLVTEEPVPSPSPGADVTPLTEIVRRVRGRTVWHVNSTALGGGVAEVIRTTAARHAAAGLASRWLVARGTPDFFLITKQLHHLLHGMAGNGHVLDASDEDIYQAITAAQAQEVLQRTDPGDVIWLHDPQTLGLAPVLRQGDRVIIWRSHIGSLRDSPHVTAAWNFLAPYTSAVEHFVFSVRDYVPDRLRKRPITIIAPGLDPANERCRPLATAEVDTTLATIGLHGSIPAASGPDSAGQSDAATVTQDAPLPADAPVVLQLSRFDPLKDMRGVLNDFVNHIATATTAHLVLAGPDPDEVADDLENQAVRADLQQARSHLPVSVRHRVHLVILRLSARAANQRIVNALLHRATVVVQKSLEEGFGMIAAEAMYHRKPVVATTVGGLTTQITDGVHGVLVDPHDSSAFAMAVYQLLTDDAFANRLAAAGRTRCEQALLNEGEHRRCAELIGQVLGQSEH